MNIRESEEAELGLPGYTLNYGLFAMHWSDIYINVNGDQATIYWQNDHVGRYQGDKRGRIYDVQRSLNRLKIDSEFLTAADPAFEAFKEEPTLKVVVPCTVSSVGFQKFLKKCFDGDFTSDNVRPFSKREVEKMQRLAIGAVPAQVANPGSQSGVGTLDCDTLG